MKRFLVFVFSFMLVIGTTLGVGMAAYVDEMLFDGEDEPLMYSPFDVSEGRYGGEELSWTHSYCCGEPVLVPVDEGSGYGAILSATLTIVADDVDGPKLDEQGEVIEGSGEDDIVYVNDGTEGMYRLGRLNDMGVRTYYEEIDHDNLGVDRFSSTTFEIEVALLEMLGGELPIVVETQAGYGVQIESSVLSVECSEVPIPSALLLLGSGVVGLIGVRKAMVKK